MTDQEARLNELKLKVDVLNSIIREGELCDEFKKSGFYEIFQRTFHAQKESYQGDAYKAAKDSRAEISAFLSRMEQIDDMFAILEQFVIKADGAKTEKYACEDEIKELNDELNQRDPGSHDVGGVMG